MSEKYKCGHVCDAEPSEAEVLIEEVVDSGLVELSKSAESKASGIGMRALHRSFGPSAVPSPDRGLPDNALNDAHWRLRVAAMILRRSAEAKGVPVAEYERIGSKEE